MATSKSRILFWWYNVVAGFLNETFVVVQAIRVNFYDEDATPPMQIYMEYAACVYMLLPVFQMHYLLNKTEYCDYINKTLDYLEYLQREYSIMPTRNGLVANIGWEKFQLFFIIMGNAICFVNLFTLVKSPDRPVLVTSLLPDPRSWKKWQLIPFGIIHMHQWLSLFANMFICGFPAYAFFFSAIAILRNRMFASTEQKSLLPYEFVKLYRSLQCFFKETNTIYGFILPSHKAIFLLMVIRTIYAAVRLTGGMRLLMMFASVCLLIYLVVIFSKLGSIHSLSCDALDSWKNKFYYKGFSKFLVSVQPVRVDIGNFYYVDRTMVLSLVSIISDNTINLLLGY